MRDALTYEPSDYKKLWFNGQVYHRALTFHFNSINTKVEFTTESKTYYSFGFS